MLPSREQRRVGGDLWEYSVKGLVFHSDTAQQRDYGLLIGHGSSHPGDSAEVTVEPLYPVGGVYHALYLRRVVEVNHVRLIAGIVAHVLEGTVCLGPPVAQVLPPFPSHLNRVVPLPGTEHVAKVLGQSGLVAMPHPGEHVAFEVRHAALQRSAWELFAHHRVKSRDAVSHHQADTLDTAFFQLVKYLAPSGGALDRHVEDAKHLPRAVFRHRQGNVERFRRHRLAAVDFDVDTVHEHDGIVLVKAASQPLVDLRPDALDHPADARLGIVLAVDLVEDVANLLLRQPLGVEDARESVAFLLLVTKDGQNARMEVAVAVSGDAELKFFPVTVGVTGTVSVPLIPLAFRQKLAAFSDHHAFNHDLQQIVETIFFLCMLAH